MAEKTKTDRIYGFSGRLDDCKTRSYNHQLPLNSANPLVASYVHGLPQLEGQPRYLRHSSVERSVLSLVQTYAVRRFVFPYPSVHRGSSRSAAFRAEQRATDLWKSSVNAQSPFHRSSRSYRRLTQGSFDNSGNRSLSLSISLSLPGITSTRLLVIA